MGGTEVSAFDQPERATQNRVIALFREELGYRYLGDWTDQNRLGERLDETRAAIVQSHAVFTKTCSFS